MVFATLVFLEIGIVLLYASYKNKSPFDVVREFITGPTDSTEEPTNEPEQ